MTYNLSGYGNSTGVDALVAVNDAANGLPIVGFLVVITAVAWVVMSQRQSGVEALMVTGFIGLPISIWLLWAGFLGTSAAWIVLGYGILSGLGLVFAFLKRQPNV